MNIAVMISNMGGPDSLEAVEPYLYNIFMDPDIIDIPLPGIIRKPFVRWIAKKRGPESREIYQKIGGKTPLTAITNRQGELLQEALNAGNNHSFKVFTGMRYWDPFIEDTWAEIVKAGYKKLVIVTLYPYYSTSTTGSMENLVARLNSDGTFEEEDLLIVDRYGDHPAFVKAMADQINQFIADEGLTGRESIDLMCSAHSIPVSRVKKGDPYRDEIESSVKALREALPENINMHLAFQSKIGPVKWLEPATPDKVTELADSGVKDLLAYPLGFVADNSETIFEIGMLYGDLAKEKGIENFRRIDALNCDPGFVEALKQLVLEKLNA